MVGAGEIGREFLTRTQAADLLCCSVSTVDDMRRAGTLRRGVHWFRPRGRRTVLFDRIALVRWAREDEDPQPTRLSGVRMNLAMGD